MPWPRPPSWSACAPPRLPEDATHRSRPECASCGARCDRGHGDGPAQRIGPGNDFKAAVFVLRKRGAAFHPVAAVHVADAMLVADGGVVDMAADHPVGAVTPRLGGKRRLEGADIVHRVLD